MAKGILVAVAKDDCDESAVGGIDEAAAFSEERGGHADIVERAHPLQQGLVRVGGLDDDRAAAIASARPTAHLHHQLKGTFVGAEVGDAHQAVSAQHTDHAHATEVKPFGQHLCADEQLGVPLLKVAEDAPIGPRRADGVGVQTPDADGGVERADLVLHALRAIAQRSPLLTVALGAVRRQGLRTAAIMTHQAVLCAMVSQADITIGATRNVATRATLHDGRVAASVAEEDRLSALSQRTVDGLTQLRREEGVVLHAPFAPHLLRVHKHNLRLGRSAITLGEGDETIPPRTRQVVRLERRRGRPKQRPRPVHPSQHQRCVARMVTWRRVVLLIRRLMLLIHHNQPQPIERQKERRPHADDDRRLAIRAEQSAPHFRAFAVGEAGMVDEQPRAEDVRQSLRHLCREGDLRQQVERLPTGAEGVKDEVEEDLRLAGRGSAVE